ncbi:hypothetical protein C8R43DRAFT_965936 [Mycena crocata]|nr:hypothetical protein C8R43DRAFT_965936 [Mycena crocata]
MSGTDSESPSKLPTLVDHSLVPRRTQCGVKCATALDPRKVNTIRRKYGLTFGSLRRDYYYVDPILLVELRHGEWDSFFVSQAWLKITSKHHSNPELISEAIQLSFPQEIQNSFGLPFRTLSYFEHDISHTIGGLTAHQRTSHLPRNPASLLFGRGEVAYYCELRIGRSTGFLCVGWVLHVRPALLVVVAPSLLRCDTTPPATALMHVHPSTPPFSSLRSTPTHARVSGIAILAPTPHTTSDLIRYVLSCTFSPPLSAHLILKPLSAPSCSPLCCQWFYSMYPINSKPFSASLSVIPAFLSKVQSHSEFDSEFVSNLRTSIPNLRLLNRILNFERILEYLLVASGIPNRRWRPLGVSASGNAPASAVGKRDGALGRESGPGDGKKGTSSGDN